ncbi:MAG TPA: hypothetical protein PLD81_02065 [Elusimicrobiales bacterium]|nr:hypothetical protein [Elusimicrobiales bacterium]HPO94777.1 hypothetical protein [Elusimicrobiales bacterium]
MKSFLFFIFYFLLFSGLGFSGSVYKLNPNARIITLDMKMVCNGDKCVMPFSKDFDLKEGDILVSTVGEGYIKKIGSVKKNKYEYEILTEPATIEEAFESLKFDFRNELNPKDVVKFTKEVEGVEILNSKAEAKEFSIKLNDVVIHDFDNNPKTTDDRIVLNGVLNFDSYMDLDMEVENSELKAFSFKNRLVQKSDFKLNISSHVNIPISFGKSIKLCEYKMAPVAVGPVVFTPIFSVILGITLSAKGEVAINAGQKLDYIGGLVYSNGKWNEVSELKDKSFLGGVSFIGAKTFVKAYIGPKFLINLYDTLGPYINGFAYAKINGDLHIKPNSFLWELYGGLEANAGVNLKILSYFQKDFNKNLIDYSVLIKSGVFEKNNKSIYDIENREINLLSPSIINNFEKGF